MVSRTARPWKRGMTTRPTRAATRKPIPKNMIGSIIRRRLQRKAHARGKPRRNHDTGGRALPASAKINLNTAAASGCHEVPPCPHNMCVLPLERVPGRVRRKLEITDIGAQAEADAGAD